MRYMFLCLLLVGCASQQSAVEKAKAEMFATYQKCNGDNAASPEWQLLSRRIWTGKDDAASKLTDPKPLTPAEKDALGVVHNRGMGCRQIIDGWTAQNAPHQMPALTQWHSRSDAIFTAYLAGEPVGELNKRSIASWDQFQSDLATSQANAVAAAQANDALVRASAANGMGAAVVNNMYRPQ